MAKTNLTDRLLKSLKPADAGKRYEIMDAVVPGLGVRVTDKGQRTFVLVRRFPGRLQPARRALGSVGAIGLADAREKARHWLKLIEQGKDPSDEEQRIQRENQRQHANTFEVAAVEYLQQVVIGRDPARPRQRKGYEVDRVFRNVLIPIWGRRPIADIKRSDVLAAIAGIRDHGTAGMLAAHGVRGFKGKAQPAPGQARNVLAYLRTLFSWAIEAGDYGLDVSPCDHLRSKSVVGKKWSRARHLDKDEIFAFWRATARLPYPFGPAYRLLLLTGLRLNEAADAAWSEFDLGGTVWTIPAERMKGSNEAPRAHVVPLSTEVIALLDTLPRFKRGDYLFTTTFGEKAAWVGSAVKHRLDRRMLSTLRALARTRGEDPRKVTLAPWVNHDLRRTVRSALSELRVSTDVAEAVLAHTKPGIQGVYNHYEYLDEKRHALELWAARVRSIVDPPPANVVQLAARA
jgi:integrase